MDRVYSFNVVAPACSNNEGITGHKIGSVDYSIDGVVLKTTNVDIGT